jgi:hypothetical protein
MHTKRSVLAFVITSAVAILVAVTSPRAQPSSISPTGQHLEGSWMGTSTVNVSPGQPSTTRPFLTTYHPDGTMLYVPNTPLQSVATGEWVRTGDRQFAVTHVRFTFDENRQLTGTIQIRATVQLHETLNAYSGQFKADTLDTNGNMVRSGEGTFQATRISIEPHQ